MITHPASIRTAADGEHSVPFPRHTPAEGTRRQADVPLRSAARWPAVVALLGAAGAHVPVIAPHLHEAPYIGALFIALTVACLGLAAALALADSRTVWDVTILVAGLAVAAYVLSRTVGLPQIGDDIGNWAEPLGLVSIGTESVAVLCGLLARPHRAALGDRDRA